MEDVSRVTINEKSAEMTDVAQLEEWIQRIDRHVLTSEPQYIYLKDDQALVDFVKLIGHESIKSEQVIAYYYSANASEVLELTGEKMNFEGEVSLIRLQEMLGDSGLMLQFPNDFRVNLAIALDDETMVLYDHQSSDEPIICEDCSNSTDPQIIQDLERNPMYGCGHVSDEHIVRNGAVITKRADSSKALNAIVGIF